MTIVNLPAEREEGNVEYKLKVTGVGGRELERLASQMKYRLEEGGGEAFYEVGVADDGEPIGLSKEQLDESIGNLDRAASIVGAKLKILRIERGRRGFVAEVHVRYSREDRYPVFVTIPLLGNVDSGKSSLIGVLTTGLLDNGNGLAMKRVARFLHEVKSGRTSSISTHLLGFDDEGEPVNYKLLSPLDEAQVFMKSAKIVCFVDLAGHERYLRTTLKGVLGRRPDYAILTVAANSGIVGMAREHLGVAIALKLPVIIVVTKIDLVDRSKVDETVSDICRLLKMPGVNRIPFIIRGREDAVVAARTISSERVTPIFKVSNTTGEGLDTLRFFLDIIPPRLRWDEYAKMPFIMYVDDKFDVKGVGLVVSGLIIQGVVKVGDILQLGPFSDGSIRLVRVKSIHVCRIPVDEAYAGQDACLAITNVEYDEVEKGMTLAGEGVNLKPIRLFEARITVLHHPTTIRRGYNATIHLHTIREAVEFLDMDREPLRTGDTANVKLRFKYRPRFVRDGDNFVFREGRTRGIGYVTSIP